MPLTATRSFSDLRVNTVILIFLSLTIVPILGVSDPYDRDKDSAENFLACRNVCGEFLPHRTGGKSLHSVAALEKVKPSPAAVVSAEADESGGDSEELVEEDCFPRYNCNMDQEKNCAKSHGGTTCRQNWDKCYCGNFRKLNKPLETTSWQCVKRGSLDTCIWYDEDGHTCLEYSARGQVTRCDNNDQGELG